MYILIKIIFSPDNTFLPPVKFDSGQIKASKYYIKTLFPCFNTKHKKKSHQKRFKLPWYGLYFDVVSSSSLEFKIEEGYWLL